MLPTGTLYKLTTSDATSVEGYTGNYTPIYTEWGEGVEHVVPPGGRLYTDQVLHAYRAPMIAVFMNPVRGDYTHDDAALLWECPLLPTCATETISRFPNLLIAIPKGG